MFNKLDSYIYNANVCITMFCLTVVIFLVFISSLSRWVGYPIQWALDISQCLFAWIVFLGADLALREKKHIGIEVFEQNFSERLRLILSIIWSILIAIFLVICIYYGIHLCISNHLRRFNSLPITYSWMTLSVPVGSTLMFITNFRQFISSVRQLRGC